MEVTRRAVQLLAPGSPADLVAAVDRVMAVVLEVAAAAAAAAAAAQSSPWLAGRPSPLSRQTDARLGRTVFGCLPRPRDRLRVVEAGWDWRRWNWLALRNRNPELPEAEPFLFSTLRSVPRKQPFPFLLHPMMRRISNPLRGPVCATSFP